MAVLLEHIKEERVPPWMWSACADVYAVIAQHFGFEQPRHNEIAGKLSFAGDLFDAVDA